MNCSQHLQSKIGNTGLKVSSIGFGAAPLGQVYGGVSEQDAIAAVHEAFRLGINFFDTSPYYGGTLLEKVLGKALKALGVARNEYIVSTKCGRYKEGFDFSAERVSRSIDESLERLQLDYVDILQCHDIKFGSLHQIVNETLPTLIKLKQAGKIRFIGFVAIPESNGIGVISASLLSMGLFTEAGPPEWHPASSQLKVEETIAAAVELATAGMDEETIAEITDILKPVKNQTLASGI
ncbi:hypothetical protein RND71_028863 [Anisodus tanguticus]|uniref:NADP-dependent oxidoreductase domain-containing protein n=1 Tax=Anisodus tanguticus TaxID=243964 RepID=A0AAE1RJ82_9SOLA|nr:hypothetical protein RND71_028863 [Anisodus tanguticus]